MTQPEQFDVIIVGSGQAGNPLAVAFSDAGQRTALIEREHIGGTCINEGCTPTKTLIASGRTARVVSRAATFGIPCTQHPVDWKAIRQRMTRVVESFRAGSTARLESAELVEIVHGEASFTAPHCVEVHAPSASPRTLEAPLIVINTGTRPAIPNLQGLDEVVFHTSTSILEIEEIPEHLVILGGGYVGLEFAQLFRRLGSFVTVIQRSNQLLPREDVDVAQAIAELLQEEGIRILLEATPQQVSPSPAGAFELLVKRVGSIERVIGSHLLVATGRTPNSDELGLEHAGIHTTDRGFIQVNDRLETSANDVYAVGDVNAGPAFTHVSYDDYRILRANLLEDGAASTAGRQLPYTVFIDPQLGRIGLTEKEACASGQPIRIAKLPMAHVARALEMDESRGFIKVIVDPQSKEVLGAAVLGVEGGELMGALQIAMMGRLPYTALRDAVFAHPTLLESFNNLFGSFVEPGTPGCPST